MTKSLTPKTMKTTTFDLVRPATFELLEAKYNVYFYRIDPRTNQAYRTKDRSKRNVIFAQTHNSIKKALGDFPYKSFVHDKIDGQKGWVIFALLPKDEPAPLLELHHARNPIKAEKYSFEKLWNDSWHNLPKLLQVAYVRDAKHDYFVGRDEIYVYAQEDDKTMHGHVCMKITLSGWRGQIRVIGSATRFFPTTNIKQSETYYRTHPKKQLYFLQLKHDEVQNQLNKGISVYCHSTIEGKRASLDYLDMKDVVGSRVDILRKFIEGFTQFLEDFGFVAQPLERDFIEFTPPDVPQLDVSMLGTIHVLDKRHNQEIHHTLAYIKLFEEALARISTGCVTFKIIDEIVPTQKNVVLVLQDANKKAYQENNILHQRPKFPDPYPEIYRDFPEITKHFFDVNYKNKPDKANSIKGYLKYDLLKPKDIERRLEVILYQLYMKHIALNPQELVNFPLPFAPNDYIYVSKENKKSPEFILYFQNGLPVFKAITDEESRDLHKQLVKNKGIDWDNCYEQLLDKYKPNRSEKEVELTTYNVIIGNGLFVDIEDLNERVLYDTQSMRKLKSKRTEIRPLEDFFLAPRYNLIKPKNFLTYIELEERGLLDGIDPTTKNEKKSLERFQLFVGIDKVLQAEGDLDMSFSKLSKGDLGMQLAKLIDALKKNKEDKDYINLQKFNKFFTHQYNNMSTPMFPSPKDEDNHLYRGIWYTNDHVYTVGSPSKINTSQARAHLLRQFDVLVGDADFDSIVFLKQLSVQFVRLNQYTVFPYFFTLLKIFREHNNLAY